MLNTAYVPPSLLVTHDQLSVEGRPKSFITRVSQLNRAVLIKKQIFSLPTVSEVFYFFCSLFNDHVHKRALPSRQHNNHLIFSIHWELSRSISKHSVASRILSERLHDYKAQLATSYNKKQEEELLLLPGCSETDSSIGKL